MAKQGRNDCPGIAWPENALNDLVLTAVRDVVLKPARLTKILEGIENRRLIRESSKSARLPALRLRMQAADAALVNLLNMVKAVGELANSPALLRMRPN